MPKVSLSELRDLLGELISELAESRLTSREIVEEFRRRHRSSVEGALDQLVNIGLINLVNQVGNRRPPPTFAPGQGDLFAGHNDIPAIVAIPTTAENGKRRFERTSFLSMTYQEGLAWLEAHIKEREDRTARLEDARRIIDRAAPFIKVDPTLTLLDGLLAASEAEQRALEAVEA